MPMLYRNFAIAVLIAAPLIVLATQSLLPNGQHPAQVEQNGQAPIISDVPPPPIPVPMAPPVATPGTPTVSDAASFGQPMAGADQPMLAPGAGLPDASPPPSGDTGSFSSSQSPPPGSPNAEN